ncbi:MAG TPA: hypothetical protein VND19_17095 [Acetobacteraceae bacterium]|nr:hypothetical protein [Acetobacteraceae bacterium]
MRYPLQRREHAVDQDAERECPNPADVVGNDAEQEAAEGPAQQPGHAEQPAYPAEQRQRRVAAEQFCERRPEHQRVETEIRRIERPAKPDHEEDQPLVARVTARSPVGCAIAVPNSFIGVVPPWM